MRQLDDSSPLKLASHARCSEVIKFVWLMDSRSLMNLRIGATLLSHRCERREKGSLIPLTFCEAEVKVIEILASAPW